MMDSRCVRHDVCFPWLILSSGTRKSTPASARTCDFRFGAIDRELSAQVRDLAGDAGVTPKPERTQRAPCDSLVASAPQLPWPVLGHDAGRLAKLGRITAGQKFLQHFAGQKLMRKAGIDLGRIIESRSLCRFQGHVQARQVLVELRPRSRADDRNHWAALGPGQ